MRKVITVRNILPRICLLALAGVFLAPAARATSVPVGVISYDVTGLGIAQLDIINFTGPNSSVFPDTTFPVTTSLPLSGLSLTISFASGPDEIFGPSYFTLAGDGLSFNGTALSTLSGQPSGLNGAIGATLTGSFSTTSIALNDGTTDTIDSSFSASISDPTGLTDGDFGVINATTTTGGGGTPVVPEPGTWSMVGTGIAALATGKVEILDLMLYMGLGAGAFAIVLGGSWILNALNLYSAALSIGVAVPKSRREFTTLVAGAAGTLLAFLQILDHFLTFLFYLSIVFVPIASIIIIDFFLLRPAAYAGAAINSIKPVETAALIAWAGGACVAVLGSAGYLRLTGIAAVDAMLVSALAYGASRWRPAATISESM